MINLSEKELDFLIELQHEMLTQDKVCQAAPRFWVIENKRNILTSKEYCDGCEIFDDNGCETVAENMEDFIKYLNEKYNKNGLAVYYNNGDAILAIFSRPVEDEDTLDSLDDIDNNDNVDRVYDYLTIEALVDILSNFSFIDEQFRVVYTREENFIAQDTMFLTNRSAKQHLKSNYYHYHKDAHPYAMTAWRSPEVKQLWEILDKINWKEMKEEKYGGKTITNQKYRKRLLSLPNLFTSFFRKNKKM